MLLTKSMDQISHTQKIGHSPGFLVRLGLFQSGKLAFGKDQAFLCHLGLQRLEPELHGAEVIA